GDAWGGGEEGDEGGGREQGEDGDACGGDECGGGEAGECQPCAACAGRVCVGGGGVLIWVCGERAWSGIYCLSFCVFGSGVHEASLFFGFSPRRIASAVLFCSGKGKGWISGCGSKMGG